MSGGIESNIFSYIDSNDGGDEQYGDTSFENTDSSNEGFDEGDEQLTNQLTNRKPTPSRNEEDEDLSDPFNTRKPNTPDDRNQRGDKSKKNAKPNDRPRTNERGDLVDEQGNVIARHGRERRIEGENTRLRASVDNLTRRNTELARQVADNNYLGGLPSKLGIDNDTVAEALNIAAMFNRDPASAVRAIAQKAIAQGLELRDIFDDESIPLIGSKAIKETLDGHLKPITEERTRAENVNKVRQEGAEAANNFLADYPDAEVHQEDIAALMPEIIQDYESRGRKIDVYIAAERAWQLLQQFGQEHQLDMSQPFKPQVEARSRQNGKQPNNRQPNGADTRTTPRQNQPEVRRSRPIPNGNGGNSTTVQRRSNVAPADDSTSSIVRQAMLEEGYTFN